MVVSGRPNRTPSAAGATVGGATTRPRLPDYVVAMVRRHPPAGAPIATGRLWRVDDDTILRYRYSAGPEPRAATGEMRLEELTVPSSAPDPNLEAGGDEGLRTFGWNPPPA